MASGFGLTSSIELGHLICKFSLVNLYLELKTCVLPRKGNSEGGKTNTHTHTNIHTDTQTHTCTHTYTHTHTDTHTQTH